MSLLDYNKLCLGAKNETVYAFESLVNQSLGYTSSTTENTNNKDNVSEHIVSTFTTDLYDKTLNTSEINNTELPKELITGSDYRYGKFTGNNIYKSLDGTLDKDAKISNKFGWITIDNQTNDYVFFKNTSGVYIVSTADIISEPVITNFQPLYDKLQETRFALSDRFFNDYNSALSLVVTYRGVITDYIVNKDYEEWFAYLNQIHTLTDFKHFVLKYSSSLLQKSLGSIDVLGYNIGDVTSDALYSLAEDLPAYLSDKRNEKRVPDYFYGVYPKQIGTQPLESKLAFNKDAINEIQAIVYDLPGYNDHSDPNGDNNIFSILYCFQQPENISYNANASFDNVSPRGSQQPFQFYASAQAIELSFTLKFHIDEVRSLKKPNGAHYSLQEIADIAENFQRPWLTEGAAGINSVKPKVVKVILPGISEIGYMSSVGVTYNGDMTGDMTKGGGLKSTEDGVLTNYHYTQLEISFGFIVLKDIKLTNPGDTTNKSSNIYKNVLDTTYHKMKTIYEDEDDLDSHMSNVSNNTDIRNIAKADESSDIINKSKEKIIDGAQRFIDGNSNIPSININDIGSKTPILDRAYTMMVDKMSV